MLCGPNGEKNGPVALELDYNTHRWGRKLDIIIGGRPIVLPGKAHSPGRQEEITMFKKFLGIFPYEKMRGITYDDLYPPLGLEVIAAASKDLVGEVLIIDMRYESKPVPSFFEGVDVAGLSIHWPHQEQAALEIISQIPPGVKVILGGFHAAQNAEGYFRSSPRVDIVVHGDGDETTREILSGIPFARIKGISFRDNGTIVRTDPRPLSPMSDLYPDRNLRRYDYRYKLPLGLNVGIDSIMSSRGCSYHCEFCTFREDSEGRSRPWSGRSAESVVNEIEQIPADLVIFCDDNFGEDVDRIGEICQLITERKIKKLFGCEMRIEIARRPDILEQMNRAGFWVLSFGLESCQDKTLRRMRKGFTVRDCQKAFEVFRRFAFFYLGYFIIGYLDETEAESRKIPEYARELGLDFIGVTCLRAFQHSRIHNVIKGTPGWHIGPDGTVYSDTCSAEEYGRIRDSIVRRFYSLGQGQRILRKCLFGSVPKKPFLKFLGALAISEFAGRGLKFPMGRLA